ncbi:hypothetical protein [Avibacterium paragallinarum]|uniref:hypothetical protein n=1 Tax=Avibacterium paragallinarum TaxID=728 RepID=UPI00398579AE
MRSKNRAILHRTFTSDCANEKTLALQIRKSPYNNGFYAFALSECLTCNQTLREIYDNHV